MRDEVIQMAEAHPGGMVVLNPSEVTVRTLDNAVEVGFKGRTVELPASQAVAEDAARYIIGAAVYADAERTGRYLYSGTWME